MQAEESREQQPARVLCGDCLDILRTLPDASIDAMIADPPAGISFMAKSWDSDKGGRAVWIAWLADVMREVLRVLKPGAHALVWSLPRTSHWTATALEDAGFEIRDSIEHVFGSGFPKSLDVSRAIDKHFKAEREVIGISQNSRFSNNTMYGNGRGLRSHENYTGDPITAPATLEAQHYAGFGTALKPAHETWWLCRAPLSEPTIAANVLKWGVGGLNIDGTRVVSSQDYQNMARVNEHKFGGTSSFISDSNKPGFTPNSIGRWPSNFILSHSLFCTEEQCADGCPIVELDQQSGIRETHSKGTKYAEEYALNGAAKYQKTDHIYGKYKGNSKPVLESSKGGASRYFATFHYCPKASKRERNRGCEELPEKEHGVMDVRPSGDFHTRLDGNPTQPRANYHPTVKPVSLLRYFVRLITPPGGLVLDPFAGSGSTGVACIQEGMRFLGIEESVEYCTIALARLAHAHKTI
jgi:DNA modification methylase